MSVSEIQTNQIQNEPEQNQDYLIQSNILKQQGNDAFAKGDQENLLLAIKHYSDAIDIDPDNHVLYSNRSAAYIKADFKSKSLYDAEKCIKINSQFVKGYSRLGAAQQALKRFPDAIATLKKGIAIATNNNTNTNGDALFSALNACQTAYEVDMKYKLQVAEYERKVERDRQDRQLNRDKNLKSGVEGINSNITTTTTTTNISQPHVAVTGTADVVPSVVPVSILSDTDIMANFFSDVKNGSNVSTHQDNTTITSTTSTATSAIPSNTIPTPTTEEDLMADFFSSINTSKPDINSHTKLIDTDTNKRDESVLTPKYFDQDLGTVAFQMERLLQSNYEFKNLNPYVVLDLGDDATIEDIKNRYKKLSTKVHPDKVRITLLKNMKNMKKTDESSGPDDESGQDTEVDVNALTEQAQLAFEQVKNAYNRLMDNGLKKSVLMSIGVVRDNVTRDRRNGVCL